jgi:phospholipase/carboxylesterase
VSVDSLQHVLRRSVGDPAGALVMLHGRGTSEHDLEPLLGVLDPKRRLLAATPRAPLTLPPGGAHWYVSRGVGYPDPDTFRSTFATLSGWLDALLAENGLSHDRLILGGFSQGTVMSYALGLGAGRPRPAGLIALSGFMPNVDGFSLDLDGLEGYPVAIGHGMRDPIIGVEWGRQAREALEEAGAAVLYRETEMGHSVDPRYLAELAGWIDGVLDA